MKKIVILFFRYLFYLKDRNGRKKICDILFSKKLLLYLRLCVFPYHYSGKYKNEYLLIRREKKLLPIPYYFSNDYQEKNIQVLYDEIEKLPYVSHENKNLYFPSNYTDDEIKYSYSRLLCEQDKNSPHRYYTDKFYPDNLDVFLDIGCAEAMSTLEIVDTVAEVYLFEFDDKWTQPLTATFRNYSDKVHIIKKRVSDFSDENNITIDECFRDLLGRRLFLKIDVEGSEMNVLKGSRKTFINNQIRCLCCTYHNEDDAENIEKWFKTLGFLTEFSKGVYFNSDNVDLSGELFRKALIRANSSKNI